MECEEAVSAVSADRAEERVSAEPVSPKEPVSAESRRKTASKPEGEVSCAKEETASASFSPTISAKAWR